MHNRQEIPFLPGDFDPSDKYNACFKCPLLEAMLIVLYFFCSPVDRKSKDFVLARKQPKGSTAYQFRDETELASFPGLYI